MFKPKELEDLSKRALTESLYLEGRNGMLARQYGKLAEAADALHAMEVRELLKRGPVELPADPPDDLIQDGAERAENSPKPPDPLPSGPPFRVRAKTEKSRNCVVCGETGWSSLSGWVCVNGHYAPSA